MADEEGGKGFSKSLVNKLRAKVAETHKGPTPSGGAGASASTSAGGNALDERARAKRAAAAASSAAGFEAAKPLAAARAAASTSTSSSSAPVPSHLSEFEQAKNKDIQRNVDFLRVLAGEKSKLAADPTQDKSYVAFQGKAQKLGGDLSSIPQGADAGTGKKRVVKADGSVGYNKGVTDTKEERDKRAAAALARLNSIAKAAAASSAAADGTA